MELGIGGLGHATEIGAGASAIVYKAIQVDLDREVAVKVLSATDEAFVRRFRREARTLGKLSLNPGIVTVHGTGVTDSGQPYLILELCESSVHDHLRTQGRFDPLAACRVGAEVADAVSDAHKNGVVHRDIKPANILRSQNGRYMITDFGIATVRDSTLGQTESIGFTVGYAAPETLRGDETGTAADVYALGATLFHMLAGHPPFVDQAGNSNLMAFAQRVINDPTPDLRPAGVPDDVCRIVEGAMAKNPTERPSADQLRDQLLAVTGGSDTVPEYAPIQPAPPTQAATPPVAPNRYDQTAAMSGIGGPPAGGGVPPVSHAVQPQEPGAEEPAKRLLAGGEGGPVPPGRADYPLPPHSDDGPRWKLALLGALAAAVVLLGGLAFVITRSNDDGVEATDTIPETPAPDEASPDDDDGDNDANETDEPLLAEIPDVTGQTENRAIRELTDDGFDVRVEERTSEDVPAGIVLSQDPSGGTEADIGQTVTIFVAVTREVILVDVPDVVGLTRVEAEESLRGIGLLVGDPSLVFSEMPEGEVVGSVPPQGSPVDSTASVSLIISKGPQPPACSDLVGLTEEAATDLIEAANLTASSEREENDSEPEGRVTACTPGETEFGLVVSDGAEICGAVTGLALEDGTAALEAKGYTVTANGELRPNVDAGQILTCTKDETTATLTFAEGLPSECPAAVTGATTADARAALEAAGFSDITVEQTDSDAVAAGRIIECRVSGEAVTVTVSTGPKDVTGTLTVTLNSINIEGPCAGDGLRPDLYGSLSFGYDGDVKDIWDDRSADDARTPNPSGLLNFGVDRNWTDVPVDAELVAKWDLEDADEEGEPGDEDGDDDKVSAATKRLDLTGESREWRPTSDANDDCSIRLDVSIVWSRLDD